MADLDEIRARHKEYAVCVDPERRGDGFGFIQEAKDRADLLAIIDRMQPVINAMQAWRKFVVLDARRVTVSEILAERRKALEALIALEKK